MHKWRGKNASGLKCVALSAHLLMFMVACTCMCLRIYRRTRVGRCSISCSRSSSNHPADSTHIGWLRSNCDLTNRTDWSKCAAAPRALRRAPSLIPSFSVALSTHLASRDMLKWHYDEREREVRGRSQESNRGRKKKKHSRGKESIGERRTFSCLPIPRPLCRAHFSCRTRFKLLLFFLLFRCVFTRDCK